MELMIKNILNIFLPQFDFLTVSKYYISMKLEDIDFFISDLHFGHYGVIEYSNRPYKHWFRYIPFLKKSQYLYSQYKKKSVQKMEDDLIKKWNRVVKPEQRILICGDFAFMPLKKMESILKKLNGKKVLVKGNHDDKSNQSYINIGFEAVFDELNLELDDIKIKFLHYPFVDKDLEYIATLRPNILKFNTHSEFRKINENEIKDRKKFFINNYRKAINVNDKDTKNLMLQLQRKFIGTRPTRKDFILVHGHTHSNKLINANAINICVEAINYTPISNHFFCEQVRRIKYNITNHTLISSINSSIETLRNEQDEINQKIKLCKNYFGEDVVKNLHKKSNLLELYINILLENPITSIPLFICDEWIKTAVKYKKFIPTDKLEVGVYEGMSRNSKYAYWDGHKWFAKRTKFGNTFVEEIDYIGSNSEYDLFIPYNRVYDNEILGFFKRNIP